MTSLDIVLVSVIVYTSLVGATFYKFLTSEIRGVSSLIISTILPILLILLHICMSIKFVFKLKFKMAFLLLFFPIINYPVAVIFFSESILEHDAMVRSNERYLKIEQKRNKEIEVALSVNLLQNIMRFFKFIRELVNVFEEREINLLRVS